MLVFWGFSGNPTLHNSGENAAHVRAALELQPDAVLVSLDGRSAYDGMSRAAFLPELQSCAPELLPFVRLIYGSTSTYCWWGANGRCRDVAQGESCEQGDPLAPTFFSLWGSTVHCATRPQPSIQPTALWFSWMTFTSLRLGSGRERVGTRWSGWWNATVTRLWHSLEHWQNASLQPQ